MTRANSTWSGFKQRDGRSGELDPELILSDVVLTAALATRELWLDAITEADLVDAILTERTSNCATGRAVN